MALVSSIRTGLENSLGAKLGDVALIAVGAITLFAVLYLVEAELEGGIDAEIAKVQSWFAGLVPFQ